MAKSWSKQFLFILHSTHRHVTHTHASSTAAAEIWEIVAYFSAASASAVGLTELLFVCFIAWHRHFAVDWVKASAPPPSLPSHLSAFFHLNWEMENCAKQKKRNCIESQNCLLCHESLPLPHSPLSHSFYSPYLLFWLHLYWALSRIQAECSIVALSGHLAFQ